MQVKSVLIQQGNKMVFFEAGKKIGINKKKTKILSIEIWGIFKKYIRINLENDNLTYVDFPFVYTDI